MAKVEGIGAAEARPALTPARRARARHHFNRAMRLVRRAHLYAGLFMVPWVFLYGGTAFLFNHPGAFPDQEVRWIEPADVVGTPLTDLAASRELAGRVVEALNAARAGDGPAYRLIRPDEAAFAREYSVTFTDGQRAHAIRLDLATRSGSVRTSSRRAEGAPEATPPFAVRGGLRLDPPPLEAVQRAMPQLLSRLGLPVEKLSVVPGPEAARGGRPGGGPRPDPEKMSPEARGEKRSDGPVGAPGGIPAAPSAPTGRLAGPELSFLMEGQGRTWRVAYNLQTGAVTGRPADGPPAEPISTRRFLTRLHLTHGYPSQWNARWCWAVAVDFMFVSMVGWGLTGLLMWWQMKTVRTAGAIVLLLGVAAAIGAAAGMHGMIAGGP